MTLSEAETRTRLIDRALAASGRVIQDRAAFHLTAARGVAIVMTSRVGDRMKNPAPPPVETGSFAEVNGMRMYFERAGAGPALVLLHGAANRCRAFDAYCPGLASNFEVITPDNRAHGRSNNPANTLSYSMMADDTAELVRVLGLQRPLIAGYSDGGQIAVDLALRYPGLTRAYVIGASIYRAPAGFVEGLRADGMAGPGIVDTAMIEQLAPDYVSLLRQRHDAFQGPNYWHSLLRQISELWYAFADHTVSELARIAEPVLILSGDRDEYNPLDQQIEMYRAIPAAELAIMPGAHHMSVAPYSEVFALILKDFSSWHCS